MRADIILLRPDSAGGDPGANELDLPFGERLTESGHDIGVSLGQGNPPEDLAVGRFAGNDDPPAHAPLQSTLAQIESQLAFLPLGSVTLNAGSLQNWINVPSEIDAAGR